MPVMPNIVGLEYAAAQLALQQAGVLVPAAIGYFSTFPITAVWQKSAQPPSTVVSQSVSQGSQIAANAPITLGLSQFPVGVVFP